jgi:hypothetical protein
MGNNSKYVEHMLEMGIIRKSNNWVETAKISLMNTGQRGKEYNREGNKTGRLPAYSLTPLIIMDSMRVLFYRILGEDRTNVWAISQD